MACCFRCGRFLGERDEWKKMDTQKGAICYVCFNEVSAQEKMSVEKEKKGKQKKQEER